MTSIAMPFCFTMQSFNESGQLAAELWEKNDFQYGVRPPF